MSGEATGTRLLLGPGDHGREVEERDYLEAEFEEGWRYELVGGRLVVMSPNSEEHADAAEPWLERLFLYKATNRDLVQKIVPEAWVRIGPKNYRIGDIGVYLQGSRSTRRRPARAPELMIEILSMGRDSHDRDYVEKRAEYHSIEILEYLIVDPHEWRVTVLALGPNGYDERILNRGEVYTSALLPGLEIPLDAVFGA